MRLFNAYNKFTYYIIMNLYITLFNIHNIYYGAH